MNILRNRIELVLPLVLGLYCLTQGMALALNADPIVRIAGFGVLLWVPGCAYCTRRAYQTRLRPAVAMAQEPRGAIK